MANHKFTRDEKQLLKTDLPEHWSVEDGYLIHPIGDRLVKEDSGAYPYTLYQENSFKDLKSALAWLKKNTMNTKDFAYMAAVLIHSFCEMSTPDDVEDVLIRRGYTKEEAKAVTDEAYRRRLE